MTPIEHGILLAMAVFYSLESIIISRPDLEKSGCISGTGLALIAAIYAAMYVS